VFPLDKYHSLSRYINRLNYFDGKLTRKWYLVAESECVAREGQPWEPGINSWKGIRWHKEFELQYRNSCGQIMRIFLLAWRATWLKILWNEMFGRHKKGRKSGYFYIIKLNLRANISPSWHQVYQWQLIVLRSLIILLSNKTISPLKLNRSFQIINCWG
jgi:hypothetical protein